MAIYMLVLTPFLVFKLKLYFRNMIALLKAVKISRQCSVLMLLNCCKKSPPRLAIMYDSKWRGRRKCDSGKQNQKALGSISPLRGRSQLSTFMKAYKEYAF